MKNSVLFSLTFMVIETLATLRPGPKDPFLVIPQLQCKGRQRIVPDPKYCDRVLLCGEGPEKPSIVQYCPNQMVFVPRRGCVPVNRGAQHCKSQFLETPNKVHHMCQPNLIAGNRTDIFETPSMYFEKLNENIFALCPKKKFSRGAIPAKIYECYDPDLPEVVNDSDDLMKCKPKGFLMAQKKTKELLAKESHFTPKKEVLAGKGLPVVFRDERPVCPTSKVMRQRFEFDHTTRFPDNSDCLSFWTCNQKNQPEMGSCPKAFRQVFHPRLQKCVHYQDPGIPEPCNKFFDQDSKLDKSYANSDLTHGQFLAQMVNFIRILRDIKSQNLEQFLFIKEETKNFFKKHGSKFPADETILKALEDLEIEVETQRRSTRSLIEAPQLIWTENGPRCPPVPFLYPDLAKDQDLKKRLLKGEVNPATVYDIRFFLFGHFNMMPDPEDCGKYYRCDATDAYNDVFLPKHVECYNNFVFRPAEMQSRGLMVPNTGRCVNPTEFKIPGCENWKSKGNPLTTLVDKTESGQYRTIYGDDATLSYDALLQKYGLMDYEYDYQTEVEQEKETEEEDPRAQLERIIEVETSNKKVVQAKAKTESITPTVVEKKEGMTLERILREITEKNEARKESNFEHFKARSLTKRDLDSEIEKLKEMEPKKFPMTVQGIFDEMCPLISVNGVKEVQGIFEYIITGVEHGTWYVDMKNGKGSCGLGQAPVKPDVKLWMSDQLFHQLFSGQIESMTAFATQKLKLRGDITKALKLDKILAKIRGSGYFILPQKSKF